MMIFEWILLSAIPAIGLLVLVLVLERWGKRNDRMGGVPGHIWKSEKTPRPPGSL